MEIVCLDLEGVLVPEIWIAFAEATGIPELKKTTRDEPDYDKLMNWRLSILKEHGLGLKEIQETISRIDPLPGAREFLDKLSDMVQFLIPNYVAEGKNQLVVAIGCTGGKHRSVTIANKLYEILKENREYKVKIEHRDIGKVR